MKGRDHHIKGYSMFLAGGGMKQGLVYGATDELGYNAVDNIVNVRDLHATMLASTRHRPQPAVYANPRARCEIDRGETVSCGQRYSGLRFQKTLQSNGLSTRGITWVSQDRLSGWGCSFLGFAWEWSAGCMRSNKKREHWVSGR